MRFAIVFFLFARSACAQTALQTKIRAIAADAHGKVSVACSLPDSSLNCDLDPYARPPMESVFKLPLAVATLDLVQNEKFSLDQLIRFLPSDRILPHVYSPLQDKYPDANVDIPLQELLRLAVSLSDNVAADIVLRGVRRFGQRRPQRRHLNAPTDSNGVNAGGGPRHAAFPDG